MGDVRRLSVKRGGVQSERRRENMELYLSWLLTPSAERRPPSRAKLAAEMGLSSQTLRNYGRDPWLQAELAKRGRALNRVERVGDVVDSLFGLATGEDVPASTRVSASKAFLEWVDKRVEDSAQVELADLSFDELRAIINDLEKSAAV